MAECNIEETVAQAVANGFLAYAQSEPLYRSVVLQLLKNASGNTQTAAELKADAIANGFLPIAQSEPLFRSEILQMLCNAGG